MNKENKNQDQSALITSNAFLEHVMPQIKINQDSFPLHEYEEPNEDITEVPAEEKRFE